MTYGSYFYDHDPMSLPQDTQHFFNVLVICIAIPPDAAADILPEGVEDIWYLDKLTDPRPIVYHFYIDDIEQDPEWETTYQIEAFPHSVVELYNGYNVTFYHMLDFETDDTDPWEINPIWDDYDEEDFDYDPEDDY